MNYIDDQIKSRENNCISIGYLVGIFAHTYIYQMTDFKNDVRNGMLKESIGVWSYVSIYKEKEIILTAFDTKSKIVEVYVKILYTTSVT